MKVTKQKAAENRAAVVTAASRLFRDHGFVSVGLNEISSSAGLTNGGFYRQFESKEALFAEACREALQQAAGTRASLVRSARGHRAYRRGYLKEQMQERAYCPAVTLGADVSRGDAATQAAFAEGLEKLLGAGGHKRGSKEWNRDTAEMAQLMGALLMARAVRTSDAGLAKAIVDAVIESPMTLDQENRVPSSRETAR